MSVIVASGWLKLELLLQSVHCRLLFKICFLVLVLV